MANVTAIKAKIAEDFPPNPMGLLSAYIRVQATGFNGMRVFKRVRIGLESGVTVDNAKEMMRSLRAANNGEYGNPSADISGKLVIEV